MDILGRNLTGTQSNFMLELERRKAFGNNGGIMCKCVRCGGMGCAQDETMLDSKGFLKGAKCPCGGKIKKA